MLALKMTTTDLDVIAKISAHLGMELSALAADCVTWCFGGCDIIMRCDLKEIYFMPYKEDDVIDPMVVTRIHGCLYGTDYEIVD